MKELEKLLHINSMEMLSPNNQGKNFIEIRCYCDFEGHGKASEMWEKHWELKLPMQQAYWKSTQGYVECKKGLKQSFHGKEFNEVIDKAKMFLKEISCDKNF